MTSTFRIGVCSAIAAAAAATASLAWAADDITDQAMKNRRDLINAGVSAPKENPAAAADLSRAIERIQQVHLTTKKPPEEQATDTSGSTSAAGLGGTVAEIFAAAPEPAGSPSSVSDAVLDEIKRLAPDKVADPMKLADILYQGGRLAEAVPFYQKAYDAPADPAAKAWALFQMANCRRQTDAVAAVALYRRVTTEFPKSPWKAVAEAECRLIEWRQTIRPDTSATSTVPALKTASAAKAAPAAPAAAAPSGTQQSPAAAQENPVAPQAEPVTPADRSRPRNIAAKSSGKASVTPRAPVAPRQPAEPAPAEPATNADAAPTPSAPAANKTSDPSQANKTSDPSQMK
jgi:tetratricopeptide (TPR) repeat protein